MARPGFTLEQIRSFVAVAETEHITRAAAQLFLTQGAVTQQVRHFEQSLGLQLLERDGRRVRLTDAGRSLAEACRAALRAMQVLDDTAQAMKHVQAGSLHVGASPTSATYYLPPHLAGFAQLHPAVKLDLAVEPTADLNRRVLAGTLDCAVIEGTPDPNLLNVEIAQDELVIVAHRDHPLAHLKRIMPDDFAKHLYLGRGRQFSAVREMLGDAYDRVEVMNLSHPEYVRAAALAGLGFAALSRRAVAADLQSGVLKRLPIPPFMRKIRAARRQARSGPALEAFWELLTGGGAPASGKISSYGRGSS
ncbi:MAG TPA: LysR family transcriptional regulator [Candidatus Dormibacteraeota bacterium]|jgi:DNA-binding transcriptional LysR family regulator|nr:LysR family transcriptional regulator [Candidatus Dormibacteraeota bacterium]